MSQDRATGDLWIGDVGDGTAEEVNRVRAGQIGREQPNFGFPYVEGLTPVLEPAPPVEFDAPVWFHGRQDTDANSIIGGYRYRGSALPELSGKYVFSDFSERIIRAIDPDSVSVDGPAPAVATLPSNPTSFAEEPSGELLVLTIEGGVFRLVRSRAGDELPLVAERVLGITTGKSTGDEATSLAVLPDGSGVLGALRGGQVTWTPFDPDAGRVCEFQFVQLPQRPRGSGVREYVESNLALIAKYGGEMPVSLAPELRSMTMLFERAGSVGATQGWDSAELDRLLSEAALERGEFAHAQRAESSIANYVTSVCS